MQGPHDSAERERVGWMANSDGRQSGDGGLQSRGEHGQQPEDSSSGRLEYAAGNGREQWGPKPDGVIAAAARAWSDFDVLPCADGKARRVESGTFPLAHGVPGRVGLLRGYGNAIVPQVAAEFIGAFLEIERERKTT
jgi:DNA (cytosine-5)-methyltransferase 1